MSSTRKLSSTASRWLLAAALVFQSACGSDDPKGPGKALVPSRTTVVVNTNAGQPVGAEYVSITATGSHVVDGLDADVVYPTGTADGWLTATLSDDATPATLTLQINTSSLAPAMSYSAAVQLSGTGVSTRSVLVTLNISGVSGAPVGSNLGSTR